MIIEFYEEKIDCLMAGIACLTILLNSKIVKSISSVSSHKKSVITIQYCSPLIVTVCHYYFEGNWINDVAIPNTIPNYYYFSRITGGCSDFQIWQFSSPRWKCASSEKQIFWANLSLIWRGIKALTEKWYRSERFLAFKS